MSNWNSIKDGKLSNLRYNSQNMMKQAKDKRDEMSNYERKKNIFLLYKWEIIKVKKEEMLKEKI